MAKDEKRITIDTPADEVWKLVSDFGGLADWFPGIDSCRLEGDDRHLEMGGMKLVERLLERDDAARSLSYSVVEGIPMEKHRATITVTPAGEGSSEVTYAWDVEPDAIAAGMGGAYGGALDAMKAKLEG